MISVQFVNRVSEYEFADYAILEGHDCLDKYFEEFCGENAEFEKLREDQFSYHGGEILIEIKRVLEITESEARMIGLMQEMYGI